jgi:hypothetical protein
MLRRPEVASLVANTPIPLVGYVRHFADDEPRALVRAQHPAPPPAALVQALTDCLADRKDVGSWDLSWVFDPERDLEPHWTLELVASAPGVKLEGLGPTVFSAVAQHLPPPGYLDVMVTNPKPADC